MSIRYKLGEICDIVSGSTPKTSVSEYWDGDVKWITPAEISDDSCFHCHNALECL